MTEYLPKEPLDLPRPDLNFPPPDEELPSRAESLYDDEILDEGDVRTLLTWRAPGRPFQEKGKTYFLNMLLLIVLLEIVVFLFHEYLLMLVIASLAFVAFALAVVKPHDFFYKISTEGITIEDHFFLWQELYDFYFKQLPQGEEILMIRTKSYIPGELTLVLGDLHKEQVRQALIPYLPYREYVQPTFVEKTGNWLARNFPLEQK